MGKTQNITLPYWPCPRQQQQPPSMFVQVQNLVVVVYVVVPVIHVFIIPLVVFVVVVQFSRRCRRHPIDRSSLPRSTPLSMGISRLMTIVQAYHAAQPCSAPRLPHRSLLHPLVLLSHSRTGTETLFREQKKHPTSSRDIRQATEGTPCPSRRTIRQTSTCG